MPENVPPADSKPCDKNPAPVAFETVREAELKQIGESRKARDVNTIAPADGTLIGLAFSGGGIRSATFNLGVLQSLARNQLLHKFDYLSTVSGGGYIGSWLAALTHRLRDQGGFREVVETLRNKDYEIGQQAEDRPVRWLRNYSDYLTPRTGIFTGDAGAVAGNWLRNVILNQWVLVLFLLGLILLPSFLVLCVRDLVSQHCEIMFSLGVALLAAATVLMSLSMGDFAPWEEQQTRIWPRRKQVPLCIGLFFGAACLMNGAMWTWSGIADDTLLYWVVGGAAFHFLVWTLACVIAKLARKKPPQGQSQGKIFSTPTLLFAAFGSGILGGLLLNRHAWLLAQIPYTDANVWPVIIFGTVGLMLLMQLVAVLQLGLLGNGCVDLVREWWARAGGRLLLIMLVWVVTFGVVVFGPLLILLLLNTDYGKPISTSALLAWLASVAGGIGAGKSPKTSGQQKAKDGAKSKIMEWLKSPKVIEVVAKVAPYVFIAGLLVLLSTAVHFLAGLYLEPEKTRALWTPPARLFPSQIWCGYWTIQSSADWVCILLFAVGLIIAAAVLSWRVDVNDFSMHHFYRNRLVRCYLGASNQNRKPQSFTGFDPGDEIALADLVRRDPEPAISPHAYYPGLYPILNGTLNVTRGGELGFQKRKAKPFVFTPLYCGYDVGFYQPTACGRRDKLGHTRGIALGTAMAISGAAVSPNMGFHTSPATAFFLTLFDVRLGWWMGNPRKPEKWKSPRPRLGLAYLLSELLGSSGENSSYVYLSDGAHFENLAIYELIERKCRLIVACDCGEDGDYKFEDLMSAIEKSRTDFGVDIRIDVSKIKPVSGARESENNYAVAKIHYGKDDCGILIYVKASLPKDDPKLTPEHRTPSDVVSYAQAHKCFPHQSTGDQWFDEVQFESYRALGEYIGDLVAKDTNLAGKIAAVLSGQVKSCADIDALDKTDKEPAPAPPAPQRGPAMA